MGSPCVSVIVLAHRVTERARACITSILSAGSDVPFEIVLMLNAVGVSEAIALGSWPKTRVLRSPINLGFCGGNNYAAAHATGEYFVFVNDDVLVEAAWLDALVRTARMHPEAGAIGSCILFPDGSLQEAGSIIWSDGTTAPIGRGDVSVGGACASVQDVDFCSANGLMVRRDTWTQLGGFDQNYYPAYYEDVDLCLAIRHRLGARVLYEPRSRIRHFEAASTDPQFRAFLFARNVKRLREKWSAELGAYPRPVSALALQRVARRWREADLHILIVDDRMPDAGLGSGFGRFQTFFAQVRDENYAVSFFPSADPNGNRTPLEDAGVEIITAPLEDHLKSEDTHYELVIISRPHNYERFATAARRFQPETAIVYDAEALFHRRLLQQAARETDPVQARASAALAEQMLAVEREIARSCDRVVCISYEEQAVLRELGARHVDLQAPLAQGVAFGERGFRQRDGIVFVAGWLAGEQSPNVSALRWFVAHVLPIVRERIPDVHLRVTGANPPASILKMANDHVHFVGFVEDLAGLYASARIAIAPILFGAGTKIKTIEAMQYGVPVVATRIGAEGIGARDGFGISIADDPTVFAEKAVRLLQRNDYWDEQRLKMRDLLDALAAASTTWPEIIAATMRKPPLVSSLP